MRLRLALLLACSFLAASCAPTAQLPTGGGLAGSETEQARQAEAYARAKFEHQKRVFRVLNELGPANIDLCGDFVRYGVGFMFSVDALDWSPAARAVMRAYGVTASSGVTLTYALPMAARHGLKTGDVLASVNGKDLLNVKPLEADARLSAELNHAFDSGAPLALTTRDGRSAVLTPQKMCNQGWEVKVDSGANAYADGSKITITTGLMNQLSSDDELAFVLAHEMTHNLYYHVQKQMGNAIVGAVLGYVLTSATGGVIDFTSFGADMGRLAFSKDFEREADYIGAYLAARAGYDVTRATDVMRKLAMLSPGALHTGPFATHPGTVERAQLLERTIAEINAKKASGQALLPNMKRADVAAGGG